MRIVPSDRPTRKRDPGFTLIELLLAVFLVSLLFGALVFNFTSLQPDSELTEGTDRFESLLRFARAHAAFTGCRVQVQFEEDASDPAAANPYRLRLAWEPDPWENPGVYVDLLPSVWDVEEVNQTISIAQVSQAMATAPASRDAGPSSLPLPPDPESEPPASLPPESGLETPTRPAEDDLESTPAAPPPITFFPDGSSDSAQILLAARSAEDRRTVRVRLAGITGSITHEWIAEAEGQTTEEDEAWIEEFLEEMEAAEPVP